MSTLYPIAEEFSSIQGEGVYCGTPMRFVRLAGCNVGVYGSRTETEQYAAPSELPIVYPSGESPRHSICTNVFGEKFLCDTDYHATYKRDLDTLLDDVVEEHICLTGGEPFMHDVKSFYLACLERDKDLHIETSGTHDIIEKLGDLGDVNMRRRRHPIWITCSPKRGFLRKNLQFIDEWKFIAGPNFDPMQLVQFFDYKDGRSSRPYSRPIYLQPVNHIGEVDGESVARVLTLLESYPRYRLSVQMHKYLRLR